MKNLGRNPENFSGDMENRSLTEFPAVRTRLAIDMN